MSLIPFLNRRKVKISKSLTEFVELDCTLSENIVFDTQVTDHPVESGTNVSDHSRILPRKLHLSSVHSNQPLTLTQVNLNPERVTDALGTLLLWQQETALLSVATTLTTYPDMHLKTISVKRDSSTGNVAAMELDFQEVRVVSSAFAEVEPKTDVISAKPQKPKGKVAGKPLVSKSVFSKITGVGA